MERSHISGCDNDAIAVTSNLGMTPVVQGTGAPQAININIDRSSITGSRYHNLWVNNLTPLGRVAVKVQNSNLATSTAGVPVAFDQQPTGTTGSAQIDLGGGLSEPAGAQPRSPRSASPGPRGR